MKAFHVWCVDGWSCLVFATSASKAKAAFWRAWKSELDNDWRQAWRALNLVVKAKLEAVESGITTFEDEFLAHIMLPDGSTVGHLMRPQLEAAYDSGSMPKGLPGLTFEGGR
ncbi:MAG: hypothetical protein K9M17_05480 [Mariprofundaceae bacterium]|nr:hypothetical protein [Mariprofundaceae bacterium]